MINFPLVTVYITTHNRLALLKRAVDSVLNQDYSNIELIISDDASSDGTDVYCLSLMQQYKNVIYIKNKKTMGACFTRNEAIKSATGIYITGLDDDDFFDKNRVSYFIENWNHSYSFICTRSRPDIQHFISKFFERLQRSKVLTCESFYKSNPFGNQIFISSDRLKKNLFDLSFPALQDFELWYRISKLYGPFKILKKTTQTMDFSHSGPRITTVEKRLLALNLLSSKYTLPINNFDLIKTIWKVEFGQSLSFFELINLLYNLKIKCFVQYFYYKYIKKLSL
jgi:glycosyltransferase involved in cell wall biosynthesis